MPYTYDEIFAKDTGNPGMVAKSATVTIFDPDDPAKAPVPIFDVTGSPLPNPIQLTAEGFGPAFQSETLDRVGWFGAGFQNYFTSYEGMRAETQAAKAAAQASAASASAAAADAGSAATASLAAAVADAEDAATSAANSAALVGAPADTAIATAINAAASATKTALSATYVTYVDSVTGLPLVGKHVIITVDQTTDDISDIVVEEI